MDNIKLDTIEEAIEEFRAGHFVIVVDDEDRENEGDLIMAAEKVTPDHVNFMVTNARGELCCPLTISRCKELGLEMLDARDILAPDFSDRLVKAIREHDLVSLKWKKV